MMRTRLLALILIVCVLVLVGVLQASEKATDAIIVIGADAIWEDSPLVSQDLLNALVNVDTRVVAQYANDIRREELTESPTALQTLLGSVPDRVMVQYAATNRREYLVVTPGELQGLLGQVRDRNIVQYADDNLSVSLEFPHGLIDDTFPPVVSNINITPIGDTSVTMSLLGSSQIAEAATYYLINGSCSQTSYHATNPFVTCQMSLLHPPNPPPLIPSRSRDFL